MRGVQCVADQHVLPACQCRFRSQGKLRQTDLLETRRRPPSVAPKICSQAGWDLTVIAANPVRSQVARSHSTRKVLASGT